METTQTNLSDLALRYPAASRLFQKRRLDFCCGGKQPLADACSARGLDADALLGEILATKPEAPGAGWESLPLHELAEHIVTRYHVPLRDELEDIGRMAEKVERVHDEKASCPRGLAAHLRELGAALLEHMQKEEDVLFPAIRAGQGHRALGSVQALELEHRDVAAALRRSRALTDDLGPPPEACTTWRALYLRLADLEVELMEHMHLENNVLFPRALAAATR